MMDASEIKSHRVQPKLEDLTIMTDQNLRVINDQNMASPLERYVIFDNW